MGSAIAARVGVVRRPGDGSTSIRLGEGGILFVEQEPLVSRMRRPEVPFEKLGTGIVGASNALFGIERAGDEPVDRVQAPG